MILQATQSNLFLVEDLSRPGHNTKIWLRRLCSFYPIWDPPVNTVLLGARVVTPMENGRNALMLELPDLVSPDQIERFSAHLRDRGYVLPAAELSTRGDLYGIGWSLYNQHGPVVEWTIRDMVDSDLPPESIGPKVRLK